MPKVPVVEDEAPLLMWAEHVLQIAGYETVCASTVGDALAIIANTDIQLALLFTDLGLRDHIDDGGCA